MSSDYADEFVKKFMTESSDVASDVAADEVTDAAVGDATQNSSPDAAATTPSKESKGLSHEILIEQIVLALRTVFDPEIPVNVYDLGLIYSVDVDDQGMANVVMTLTNPGCPVAHTFPGQIENTVRDVEGVCDACVELVWDPPWTKDRMSEAARLELGMF